MGKNDARQLAQAGFWYLGRSYSEMDCQGFVERLLHDGYTHIDAAYGGSDYTAMTIAKKQRDGTIVSALSAHGIERFVPVFVDINSQTCKQNACFSHS